MTTVGASTGRPAHSGPPIKEAGERYELLLVEDSPGDVDLIKERLSDVPGYRFSLNQ